MSYYVLNPDSPIVVLIIGPSQNGKTTFINRIIRMAGNDVPYGREGDRNTKCTKAVSFFDVDVPTSEYVLIDREKRQVFDVPDIATDEDKVLGGGWWRRQRSDMYDIRPRDPQAPYLRLRLIDTPGLDDSENKDFENMEDVLRTLNNLSRSSEEWERQISAIVLVYNSNNPFSFSFQTVIKHYHQCMPNLFGGLAVVNTHFDLANLSRRKAHLIRDKLLGSDKDSARNSIIKQRAEDFRKALGETLSPNHFFLDSKPKETLAYPELLSRNTVAHILSFWRVAKPMPITQMRMFKSADMLTIDAKLQRGLQMAIDSWTVDLRMKREAATDREALKSKLLQQKEEGNNAMSRLQEELDRIDTTTVFSIRTYVTEDDPSVWRVLKDWTFRKRIRATFPITESEYDEFEVVTENSPRGKWIPQDCHYDSKTRTWTGTYESEPGKSPNLIAKAQTTNQVKHRQRIEELRREKRRLKASLVENQMESEQRYGAERMSEQPESERDEQLNQLVRQVETASHLIEVLRQKSPPIDKAFNEAARVRYTKRPGEISVQDLIDFAAAAELEFDIVRPLRRELVGADL
ncbi:hypothetical protein B0T17DRAFT_612857 [Bombardia bombarda]|uniref:G domain-containing protein n=1 Tax=Bombardia bombarda TaxID=252184 RepID=A0AA39XL73_9PEZI|nr:hypothetical protein B0T17DRAFT_612857 [Bombardia bombarda]